MTPLDFHREIATVYGEVTAADSMARVGRSIDLDGLDARIAALCVAALGLPSPHSREVAPVLGDLHAALDRLAARLRLAASAGAAP